MQSLYPKLHWENDDPDSYISLVPTSANTGEGLCDFLRTLLSVLQRRFLARLETKVALECTVMEVREVAGMGTTVDVLLRNGALHEGDHIIWANVIGCVCSTLSKGNPVENCFEEHTDLLNQVMKETSMPISFQQFPLDYLCGPLAQQQGLHAGQPLLLPPHLRRLPLLEHHDDYVHRLRRHRPCALPGAHCRHSPAT